MENRKDVYVNALNNLNTRLNYVIDVLDKCSIEENDSIETIIFKKYIELGDITKVAAYLNDNGYRIRTSSHVGERKYISNDITKIILSKGSNVDNNLVLAVREIKELDKVVSKIKHTTQ